MNSKKTYGGIVGFKN